MLRVIKRVVGDHWMIVLSFSSTVAYTGACCAQHGSTAAAQNSNSFPLSY